MNESQFMEKKSWTSAGWQWSDEYIAALRKTYAPELSEKEADMLGTIFARGSMSHIRKGDWPPIERLIDLGFAENNPFQTKVVLTDKGATVFDLITPNEENPIEIIRNGGEDVTPQ